MNISAQHLAAAVALLVVGYMVGKRQAKASSSAPTAHNETVAAGDWWSYAGSWSV